MPPPTVNITWNWLDWTPSDTWTKNIVPALAEAGIKENELNRCVYVVRANGIFAIKYGEKESPAIYIGRGNFKDRITQHKNWLKPLVDLVGEFKFQIGITFPRVRNNNMAYKDFEAFLIQEFQKIYGCAPLANKRLESRRTEYEYAPKADVRSAIMIGKGVKFQWALSPMRSSKYFRKP